MSTHHHHVIWYSVVGAVVVLLLAAVGAGAITYDRAYEGRVFPGVSIGPVDVSGTTHEEATTRVREVFDARLNAGLAFTLNEKTVALESVVVAAGDPDLWYPLVEVPVPALVDAAYAVGRNGSASAQWTTRVRGAVNGGTTIPVDVTVHTSALVDALTANIADDLPVRVEASITPTVTAARVTWTVTPGQPGLALDAPALTAAVAERIATLDPAPIVVPLSTEEPRDPDVLRAAIPRYDAAIARAPISVTHDGASWRIDATTLASLLTVGDDTLPTLDDVAVHAWLARTIAPAVEVTARDAQLTFHPTTKRVASFTPSREGTAIDRDVFTALLGAAIFGTQPPLFPLPVAHVAPRVALQDTNDLGIRELLGRGTTSFAGSPANRRHNIKNGTGLLEGLLIAPGETFSTVGTVSPFDGANGYKPELVIKGNATIPEFGGGMCQVSTTLFRAVLAAGLPIVERTNHAYRVPYYEPPVGMDATIYGPKPDFRFTNDTDHHILITTRIVGDALTYELWGTSDGRIATTTEPEIYNIVQPPPTKIVPTTDLPPGKEKCIERAHPGADAKFTYTVTRADGTATAREFKSHYRAWQAVCLRGVDPATLPPPPTDTPPTTSDTTTPASIPTLVD